MSSRKSWGDTEKPSLINNNDSNNNHPYFLWWIVYKLYRSKTHAAKMWKSTKTFKIQPKSMSNVSSHNHSRQQFRKHALSHCLRDYKQLHNILMSFVIKGIISYYENLLFKLQQYAAYVSQRLWMSDHYKISGTNRCSATRDTLIVLKINWNFLWH